MHIKFSVFFPFCDQSIERSTKEVEDEVEGQGDNNRCLVARAIVVFVEADVVDEREQDVDVFPVIGGYEWASHELKEYNTYFRTMNQHRYSANRCEVPRG